MDRTPRTGTRGTRGGKLTRVGVLLIAGCLVAGPAAAQQSQDSALATLLQVLHERSLITDDEFTRIRAALTQPAPVPTTVAAAPAAAATATPAAPTPTAADVTQAVARALDGKWYERISLRGYTQFRSSEGFGSQPVPVEVPADRSVNENETLVIRRGRFIFSGDISRRLYLYAQSDFNASTGASDFSLQMRDLYADVALNDARTWRVRLGQSKVPFGFVNLQSSQNRLPMERPDALNSAVEGERDYGAYLMWASTTARQRFRDLVGKGLKGSGDYGVVALGAYSGQGLNRSDLNGEPHLLARASYPFATSRGQLFEVGVQGYHGRFVTPTQALTAAGTSLVPRQPLEGVADERLGATFVWYPQPLGLEAEWNVGRGPGLSDDLTTIGARSLNGGYLQASYRRQARGVTVPFVRWQYFDGYRKFTRNAPRNLVNELDVGVEWAPWPEVEVTGMYTRTVRRSRTSVAPSPAAEDGDRVAVQLQWNY